MTCFIFPLFVPVLIYLSFTPKASVALTKEFFDKAQAYEAEYLAVS